MLSLTSEYSTCTPPLNSKSTTKACYRRHEKKKRREYERRVIEVEHGIFAPLVLSTSGGWDPLQRLHSEDWQA